jgi:hypothetical protein
LLKVLARLCDGQFQQLQDYLREQPDNIKSFNLIAETVQYMSQVYANINPNSINLIIQLLDSLNECVSVSISSPLCSLLRQQTYTERYIIQMHTHCGYPARTQNGQFL